MRRLTFLSSVLLGFNDVFKNENTPSNGWDGQYKGQAMPVGAYLFWGMLALESGETKVINGALNLVR